ncbi:hypothetical protein CEXT_269001 [Caerostris extrusa]|uniref:Uncharacterized protein n=1 Tax=Caerostris extrusa TaxID=172846 RepID=A0AAV4R7P2_CAEEX|nr:hypothetical protein CEXT_269001 [Caerostris extrusa]
MRTLRQRFLNAVTRLSANNYRTNCIRFQPFGPMQGQAPIWDRQNPRTTKGEHRWGMREERGVYRYLLQRTMANRGVRDVWPNTCKGRTMSRRMGLEGK